MAVTPTKNRGRPYSVMLLLAFAAAVMGVMALNKLREGQAHNILIDEKDREITALNLRYQREEGLSKELRSKIKDMRAKIESLRNQKKNLKSKLEEMQSLTSLKEKHRTRVAALKEKQQIEKPREKKGLTRKMYTQLVALKEALKQKEDEIHELKRQHQNPPSIQSIVSNGTSNSPTNDTVIKIVLDGDNNTDKEQEAVSKDHQANVDVVKKEQGNETPPDMNANKQIEDARAVAGKQQENLASVNELPEKGTTQHIDGISKPEDSKVDAVNQPEKVERDDVKRLGNRESDNAKSRQGETIVLVTNFDQPENPQNSTKDKQLKNREPDAADFKLENKDTDGHANTLPNGHVFKDRREKLEDADVKQNGQKDESEKDGIKNAEVDGSFDKLAKRKLLVAL